MAKKIEINENWEPVEVEDLDNLFVVIFKQGSFDQGYVEAFDTDDVLMQSAYDSLAKQYGDCGCDELTKIYLIKVPNTEQTVNMCNTGLFNGNCCDPHVIEATRDLFNRADCEQLSCWEGCGLTEAKKKKKPYSSAYCGFTDPVLNIKHFNQCMGTGGLQNNDGNKALIIGDVLPNAPVADAGNSDGASDISSSASDGGAVGESLKEDVTKELKIQNNENIEKDIEELEPPIDPEYFPNNMGINLSSVKKEIWVQQDDGQLKSIEVEFDPATEEEKEELTEAHLDYSTQLSKMRQLEAGTRGFNAGSASLEKILYNYDICIQHNLPKARKVMEDALRLHGWDQYIKPTKKQAIITHYEYILDPSCVSAAAIKIVAHERNNPQYLIDLYGDAISDILIVLVIALGLKDASLATTIKDHIVNTYTITVNELKEFLNKGFNNNSFMTYLNNTIKTVCNESLTEDTAYSHKLLSKFELPTQIKLLDQNKVEDFIKQLSPEELFRIGYATPLYFYSELDDKFDLVKATEMEGYTGLDYRDASVDAADHDARIANAQRQIDTYKDGAKGHQLNREGEKFSTSYRATNKLALNPEKSNEYIEYELDAEGKPVVDAKGEKVIKTKIDMNKILFYPRVGSTPITHYYVDFHNGQGFKPIRREVLVDTLYKFIMEVEKANAMGVSKTDLMWIQKKGYGNIKKDSAGAIEAFYKDHPEKYAISVYRKAEELGIPADEYAKEHPFSTRWSMTDFRKKAKSMFDADAATIMAQDASTVSGQELAATRGANRTVTGFENKPQVRALYSNQVYYLEGKPGKFGNMLKEGLEEDVQLDEAKRYVKRYYVRPLNIFCGNKEDIIQALIRAGDQNCSVYSLKNLTDHEDVHLLQPSDIIYYWDDRVLYDKNHVQVMDYDLFVKHEEDRKKVGNVDAMSDAAFGAMYDDRATENDLKDKDVIANYKALNNITR